MPAVNRTKLPDELEIEIAILMAKGKLSTRKGVVYAEERGFHVSRETIRSCFRRHKAEAFQATGVTAITQAPDQRIVAQVPSIPQVPGPDDFKAEEDKINQMIEVLRGILKIELEQAKRYNQKSDRLMAHSVYRQAKVTVMNIVRACTDKAHMRQFNFTFIKNEGGVSVQTEEAYKKGYDEGYRDGMNEGAQQFRDFMSKKEEENGTSTNGKQAA